MEDQTSIYRSPLARRYSTKEMLVEHSDQNKFKIWRQLWIWLAEAELALGVSISQAQVNEMKKHRTEIDFKAAQVEEQRTRNEVTAHINVFAQQCPLAGPIINLGASSFFVSDNANLIIIRNSLNLLLPQLAAIIYHLKKFAERYKDLATLAFVHLQPMHLTTVGRRACLWIQDLLRDECALRRCKNDLRFLGVKGFVGNQLNILDLFEGNHEKVKKLEQRLAKLAGFERLYVVTGQTYSRKVEVELIRALSGLGTTVHKICADLRVLAFRQIIEESANRGTSAYTRYPRKSERCCSLARFLIPAYGNAAQTHATQWLEGTFDDSAIRRLTTPESFLCADAVLSIFLKLVQGLVVFPNLIQRHNCDELPFMAMNNLITAMVNAGADQEVCENKVRSLLNWTTIQVKQFGKRHNLLDRIKEDTYFQLIADQLPMIFDEQNYTGRAADQVTEFLEQEVNPVLFPYGDVVMLY